MTGKSFSFLILTSWVMFCFRKMGTREELATLNRHGHQHWGHI